MAVTSFDFFSTAWRLFRYKNDKTNQLVQRFLVNYTFINVYQSSSELHLEEVPFISYFLYTPKENPGSVK